MAQRIEFTKMHGAGNDYIYINTMRFPIAHPEKLAIAWSDRHKGIGGDGIILIGKNESGHFTMRIFNNDGSEGKMCGNGIRCVGKYLYDNGITSEKELPIDTLSGTKLLHMMTDADNKVVEVTVDMGEPILADKHQLSTPDGSMQDGEVTIDHTNYRGTFVSMGNRMAFVSSKLRFSPNVATSSLPKYGPTEAYVCAYGSAARASRWLAGRGLAPRP